MNFRTFQATDMKEALAKVKAEMGSNAVIISSRQIKKANGAFGMFARPLVEVTAAMDIDTEEKKAPAATRTRGRQDGQRRERAIKRRKPAEKEPGMNAAAFMSALAPLRDEIAQLRDMVTSGSGASGIAKSELKKVASLSDDMDTMRSMFNMMMEQNNLSKGATLGTNYMLCYRRLVERGVDSPYAMELVKKVKDSVPGGRELDMRTIANNVVTQVKDAMMIGDPIKPYAAGPRIVSLIGPTGVGKTTTIAKIAANLVMEGKRVGLLTIDTYRIAAVEQLKIYAGILNVPLEVVLTPAEMRKALANYATKDVVLIDTAGRSQRDTEKIDELADFLNEEETIENHLVLSAAAEQTGIEETVRNFGNIPLAGLIFTKMDETNRPGVVISQNFKTGLPVVYTTHGQKVPEDIEEASAQKLALKLFKKEL